MKAVILAGGFGTRISEESYLRPKPMIEIGGMPLLWHIMKNLSQQGINDFIIAAGYKQDFIKQWFYNRVWYSNDITIKSDEVGRSVITVHCRPDQVDPWTVTIVNTGLNTQTGGRILRLRDYVGDEPFIVTYGDGVADINITEVIQLHNQSQKIGTISTYNYKQNKGVVDVENNQVMAFREKSEADDQVINIGFMVFEPKVFDYLANDQTILEKHCLAQLAKEGQLSAYHHNGFWQCMDTAREKSILENLWTNNTAPWKNWEGNV